MPTPYSPYGAVEGVAEGAPVEAGPSLKRTRQPRNSACQACAKLKMKCVAGPVAGICERCNRMGRECTAPLPKERKQSSVGTTVFDSSPAASRQSSVPSPLQTIQPQVAPVASKRKADVLLPKTSQQGLLSSSDLRHKNSRSFTSLIAQGLRLDPRHEHLVKGVDAHSIQNSQIVFRQYARHFPFVNPNQSDDPVQCVLHRPLLTMAMCAVAAASNPYLQKGLTSAIRLSISERAFIEHEQSIDLLLGLLVFLTWNHHYFDRPQTAQYLYLLAGMAADLGIHRTITEETGSETLAVTVERERAFVGVYYLCSMLSMTGFNNPSPLRWSESIRVCAANVARTCPLPSDKDLPSLVELAVAMEGHYDAVRQASATTTAHGQLVELQANATHDRLRSLRRTHPRLTNEPACIAAMIEVHQTLMTQSEMHSTSSLIQCACTIKEYIDDMLSRPPAVLHQLSLLDWTDLLNIIILMARISKPLPHSASEEAGALTSMLPPEEIMQTLVARLAAVPAGDPLAPRHEGLIQTFTAFCDTVKRQVVRNPSAAQFKPANNDDMPPPPYPPNMGARFMEAAQNGVLDPGFLRMFVLGT